MAASTDKTNKPLIPRGVDDRPVDKYNRAELYSGKALDFDGVNDVVNIGAEGGTYNDFTLVCNLKTSYASDFQSIFSTGSVQDFYINPTGQVRVFIGASYDTTNFPRVNSGEWVNFVFTRSGSTGSFYYNGVLVETLTISTTALNNTDVRIGTNQYGSYPFNGEMAGVKLFNTALTDAQVTDLYNNPEKVVPTGVDNTALKLWIPMQEGAGTTAYDGSGNGNHGTISGATYVHGIGAPVSQTAVIDWNKNKNSITHSTDFSAAAGWLSLTSGGGTAAVTNGYAESPYGGQTAARLQATKGTGYGVISFTPAVSTSGTYVSSVWAKSNTGSTQSVSMYSRNSTTGKQDITTEWTRFEFTGSGSSNYFNIGSLGTADASIDVLLWGAQMVLDATEVGAYVPTYDSAQTSPVLLPQGLTTGRDITGVNLFENVRKQGALNLDGNSWAEVHDNESLDVTTGVSLECWFYKDEQTTQSGLLAKWGSTTGIDRCYMLMIGADSKIRFYTNSDAGIDTSVLADGWNHIVGTYDKTTPIRKLYINAVEKDSDAFSADLVVSEKPVEIGRYNYSTQYQLPNAIAQPRIYNRALTASEVLNNYNTTKDLYI